MAERMVESLCALRLALGPSVPLTWLARPGVVAQERIYGAVPSAAIENARRQKAELFARASLVIPQHSLRTRRGIQIGLDSKASNFLVANGRLVWFDPVGISVFEPERALAERHLTIDFTQFDPMPSGWAWAGVP
jgi:hypothetical protein